MQAMGKHISDEVEGPFEASKFFDFAQVLLRLRKHHVAVLYLGVSGSALPFEQVEDSGNPFLKSRSLQPRAVDRSVQKHFT